jgi:tetratricopeptide (TPR) repeat protein
VFKGHQADRRNLPGVFPVSNSLGKRPAMFASFQSYRNGRRNFASTLLCGVLVIGLSLSASAAMGAGGGGGDAQTQKQPPAGAQTGSRANDLTTCEPGQVWDVKHRRCLQRRGGILPDAEMTEYAYALAKADRYQEALDVLDILQDPNTPRALNYRGYATRKLGRTDEGVSYYLKSVALDPAYPQVREYLGEAYVIQGKFDLAKDQLATIEKLCGRGCEYYQDLSEALEQAHAL